MSEGCNKVDLDKICKHLEDCLSNGFSDSVKTNDYLLAYREINRFFDLLGSIFSFVKDDVDSKCTVLESHLLGANGSLYESILGMVEFEKSNGMITAKDIKLEKVFSKCQCKTADTTSIIGQSDDNGNKKEGHRCPPCTELPSGSRSLLRLHRALNLIVSLFHTLQKSVLNQSSSIRTDVKKIYDDTLAKFHPWIIRKGVHLALLAACPSRETLISLVHHDGSLDDLKRKCDCFTHIGGIVMEKVEKIYAAHGILDLP